MRHARHGWSAEELRRERADRRAADLAQHRVEAERLASAGVLPAEVVGGSHLRGLVALARGRLAEERLVRVLNHPARRPWWLIHAKRGGQELDEAGVDVVLHTRDVGVLHLQVKSHPDAAAQFLRDRPELAGIVGVVVAPVELDDDQAWAAAMGQAILLREAAGA